MRTMTNMMIQKTAREGKCKRCARCCQYIATGKPRKEDLAYWLAHGCIIEGEVMLIPLECQMLLLRADGVHECAIYDKRPELCREFPAKTPPSVIKALKCKYYEEVEK